MASSSSYEAIFVCMLATQPGTLDICARTRVLTLHSWSGVWWWAAQRWQWQTMQSPMGLCTGFLHRGIEQICQGRLMVIVVFFGPVRVDGLELEVRVMVCELQTGVLS